VLPEIARRQRRGNGIGPPETRGPAVLVRWPRSPGVDTSTTPRVRRSPPGVPSLAPGKTSRALHKVWRPGRRVGVNGAGPTRADPPRTRRPGLAASGAKVRANKPTHLTPCVLTALARAESGGQRTSRDPARPDGPPGAPGHGDRARALNYLGRPRVLSWGFGPAAPMQDSTTLGDRSVAAGQTPRWVSRGRSGP
jgi:hypothetical protein